MKRLFAATALLLAFTAQGQADTVWYGDAFITSEVGGCANANVAVGDFFGVTYRPAGLDNGADSQIAFIASRAAAHFSVAGAQFTPGATVTGTALFSRGGIDVGFSSTLTAFASTPPTPLITTPVVRLSGTVTNFFADPNCTVTFSAYAVKRLDTDPSN
jgi:hypothetical protein